MIVKIDLEKQTITVPANYSQKLAEINQQIIRLTGDESKKKTFLGYIQEAFDAAIANSDEKVITAKPTGAKRKTTKE